MAVLDSSTIDRISAEAREIRFGKTLLTLIAAFFFGIGWISARIFGLIWLAVAWSAVAVKVGWQEGRKPARSAAR